MILCYVLRRNDTGEYYTCSRNYDKRWSPSLQKAKKYKRRCDVVNAAGNMVPHPAYDVRPKYKWVSKDQAFTVLGFELVLTPYCEKKLGPKADSTKYPIEIRLNLNGYQD